MSPKNNLASRIWQPQHRSPTHFKKRCKITSYHKLQRKMPVTASDISTPVNSDDLPVNVICSLSTEKTHNIRHISRIAYPACRYVINYYTNIFLLSARRSFSCLSFRRIRSSPLYRLWQLPLANAFVNPISPAFAAEYATSQEAPFSPIRRLYLSYFHCVPLSSQEAPPCSYALRQADSRSSSRIASRQSCQ